MNIFIDKNSLLRDKSNGLITGIIYLYKNKLSFPSDDWSDFPVIVIGWWIDSLLEISQGKSESEMRFMDGPYSLFLSINKEMMISIRGTRDNIDIFSDIDSVSFQEFTEAVLSAGSKLEKICQNYGWVGSDIEYLIQKRSMLMAISL